MLQSSVSCDMLVLCFMFLFYVIITNTMAYWYDGAALAATRSPVIALFWCLIKFTTTTTTTNPYNISTADRLEHIQRAAARFVHHDYRRLVAERPMLLRLSASVCRRPLPALFTTTIDVWWPMPALFTTTIDVWWLSGRCYSDFLLQCASDIEADHTDSGIDMDCADRNRETPHLDD